MRGIWSIKLFRLFGIEVKLHLTFFLLLAWLGWEGYSWGGLFGGIFMLLAVSLVFACVLFHEFGHTFVAMRYGIKVPSIILLPIGGMAQFSRIPREPAAELWITLAGPAVNVAIAGLIWVLHPGPISWQVTMAEPTGFGQIWMLLLIVNLFMAAFNLLPIFPMDGGRILRALLATRLTYLGATRIAVTVGKALAATGVVLAVFYFHHPILAVLFAFIYLGGNMEYAMVLTQERYRKFQIGDATTNRFLSILDTHSVADAVDLVARQGPGDFVVFSNGGRVAGLLSSEALERAARQGRLEVPVVQILDPNVRTLQASWPLETFTEYVAGHPQRIFPVFQSDRLIGVLDSGKVDHILKWRALQDGHPRIHPTHLHSRP